jgi:hypothetical protein
MIELGLMLDELNEIKSFLGELLFPDEDVTTPPQIHRKKKKQEGDSLRLIIEIHDLAERITGVDKTEGEALAPTIRKSITDTRFPDRLHLLKRQLKTKLGAINERIASTSYFSKTLSTMRNELDKARKAINSEGASHLVARCDEMCGGMYIKREDFMTLYEDITRFATENCAVIANSLMTGQLRDESVKSIK